MDRKEFIKALGISTGAVVFSCCLEGCSKSDGVTTTPPTGGGHSGKVDFTFDVTSDTDLRNNGWTI